GLPASEPCTPKGILRLLKSTGIPLAGKEAVVIGRSNIVGKPVALMLLAESATVTICHSKTADLAEHARRADILVAAIGKPRFVTADMVKEGAVVIDVGINRLEEGLVGDVDYEPVAEKASWITPVPGGVGPMTIAMLLENTLEQAEKTGASGR
ncbi:MAG: bifunctional 5,10-methylene-tetrahydrofolate dehydrogenase/5,10-methylene-tetrahydrofolate cyclohydrolase, partial [Synergistetes bacterium HGW-Synergistetes-2]